MARQASFTSSVGGHTTIGTLPIVYFGNEEQKKRMLPPLIAGEHRACFAVTEPNTGLNTKKLKVKAERRGSQYIVSGQKVWISTAQVAEKVLLLARAEGGLTLFYVLIEPLLALIWKRDPLAPDALAERAAAARDCLMHGLAGPAAGRGGLSS